MTFEINNSEKLTENVNRLIKNASLFLQGKMSATSDEPNPSSNIDIEISNYLSENLPSILNIPVLSEESESQYKLFNGQFIWVIDPLDGTLNALTKNIPFCISISLVDLTSMKAVISCNYVPYKNELYNAIKGKGAYLNDKRITKSAYIQKIVGFGLPGDVIQNLDFHVNHFKSILNNGFITRQSGSAVHDIILTALGKNHAFYEFGLYLWDFIGADLIASECGCISEYKKSTKHEPNDLQYDYVVSNNKESLTNIKKILNF